MAAEEIHIPKLANLSVEAAVEGFKQNTYSESETGILQEYNDKLFDELYIPHVALTPEVVEGILNKKLTASEIVLGRNNLDELHRRMTYSQVALEKFTVLDWNVEEKYIKTMPGRKRQTIDIIAFLKDSLCPESRLTLRELCIRGHGISFPPEWVSEMLDLLPGITALDLSGCNIRNENFRKLCERYSDLTELYIEGTNVDNLDGIEKLVKLKTLSLENLYLDSEESIVGLSSLQNLKVLNVSFSEEYTSGSQLSIRDQISVPNLKVFVMSCCDIDTSCYEERARKLFNLNPNLEEILHLKCVCYLNFTCSFFERDGLHHEADAGKFCFLLEHYEKSPDGCKLVLRFLPKLLSLNQIRNEENTKKILMCLIEVLRSPMQNYETKSIAIVCLYHITEAPDFRNTLTFDEKEFIGKTLCTTIKTTEWVEEDGEISAGRRLFSQIIQIAFDSKLFEPVKLDNAIADVCVHFLTKSFCFEDTPMMCEYLVLRNQKVDILSKFKTNSIFDIKVKILKNLQERELNATYCKPLLEFFAIVAKIPHSQLEIVDLNHNYVDIIFKKMEFFEYDENIVQCGFICLQLLYHQLEDLTRKREQFKNNSQIIKTCILSDSQSNKTAVIKFMIEAYKSNIENKLYEPLEQPEMNRIVAEVLTGDDLDKDQIIQLVGKLEGEDTTSDDISWLHQKLYKEL